MDSLTEPIGDKQKKHTPLHVDEWLDSMPETRNNHGENYARWWLEYARMPAWKKMLYSRAMSMHELYCTYQGKAMRCTGASRMGDVWLTADHDQHTGYQLRVDVQDCSEWRAAP